MFKPKFIFATWLAERSQKIVLDAQDARHRLLSYALIKQMGRASAKAVPPEEYFQMPMTLDLFLDSGAFSAWKKQQTIDVEAYAQFVLDHPGAFQMVANLDVIPGSWGEIPSQREIDRSAEQGWENLAVLRKRLAPHGIEPIHIFHQGESPQVWLKRLLDDGGPYIGISPGNDRTTKEKILWLDEIMPLLTDDRGYPIRKMHGFGVTALEIMHRFPFFSVDSSSWVMTSRFGGCYIPLSGRVHKVTFSQESPKMADLVHFQAFSKAEQRIIREYVEGIGQTVEALATDYSARDSVNIRHFLDVEKAWTLTPWKRALAQPRFF